MFKGSRQKPDDGELSLKNVWLSAREGYEQRDVGCWSGLEFAGIGNFRENSLQRDMVSYMWWNGAS